MNEQKSDGRRKRGSEKSYLNVLLVIAPAMAAPAPVGPAAPVIAPTTAAAVITAASIIPPTAVCAAAAVHTLAAPGSALIAVAEDPIGTLTFRNLVLDVLEIDPALLNIGTAPLEFACKIGQLSRPVTLPDPFRDQRRSIL